MWRQIIYVFAIGLLGSYALGMSVELTGNGPADSDVAKDYELCFLPPEGTVACMSIAVNPEEETISFHMREDKNFNDVATLENYEVGLAASREGEYCYVRCLASNITLKKQVAVVKEHQNFLMMQATPGEIHLQAIPFENPNEILGEKLVEFCRGLMIFKLLASTASEDLEPEEYERLGALPFTKCSLFISFGSGYKCFDVKPIVPTSASAISFQRIFKHS